MVDETTISVDGSPMRVISAMPEGDGPHPVYVECCHGPGQDAFNDDVIQRLAGQGYAAFSHNLFHRQPSDIEPSERVPTLTDEEMVRDGAALLVYIRGLEACDSARMAIGGHCMGGRAALLTAATLGGFKAVADFWGGNVMTAKGREAPTVLDMMKDLDCPVIGFFGNDDQNPSPADADRLDQELTAHNIKHSFHRYDGAGHAFQNFMSEERYRKDSAEDAWAKVYAFFADKVG